VVTNWARNGEVELAYDTFGAPQGEPVLLIMGQMFQMVWWPDEFCSALADRGFAVARFDNRDSGLSTHFRSPQREHALRSLTRAASRNSPRAPYTGADLSDDVVSVMDALGWESAHLVGASMGGSIAQATALRHPDRVRSLTSISAGPGDQLWKMAFFLKLPTVLRLARITPGTTREDGIRTMVEIARAMNGSGFPFDEEAVRRIAETSHDRRPLDPSVAQRHSGAGWAGGRIRDISAPALVLHGENDPILRVAAGRATARAIPGARFVSYPGMGHDLPEALWPSIIDEIEGVAARSTVRG
jgi:pimeloyl-ACP methyl ester carboxylesterase